MIVIISHQNVDFDGLASMKAAQKLYPDAIVAISDKLDTSVTPYMAIYRDALEFMLYQDINWHDVSTLILVDVATLKRTGIPQGDLSDTINTIIYDHHPPFICDTYKQIEKVGSTTTLLLEQMIEKGMKLSSNEATLFGLGLYSDTGNFTFDTTTNRDFRVAAYLFEQGLDIELVNRFVAPSFSETEQKLFEQLYDHQHVIHKQGLTIVTSFFEQKKYQNGLGTLAGKLLDTNSADAIILAVRMDKHVYISCRANSSRIDFGPFIKKLGGGGHAQAASAILKKSSIESAKELIDELHPLIIEKATLAKDMMSSPVKMMNENDSVDETKQAMIRFGHTGFPVIDDTGRIVGLISRRDIDKASHHQYGHAPVKGYMTREIVTLPPSATLEEIQRTMIQHNIGRIPIVDHDVVVGLISRTNVIAQLQKKSDLHAPETLIDQMKDNLPKETFTLLNQIGQEADRLNIRAFLVGGFVRDLLLNRSNEDLDVVIEGNGIDFAKALAYTYGGEVKEHESFGTATWTTTDGEKIDVVTCRTEYYEESASLPTVRASNIHEDLTRRDFTINAMAMVISADSFGQLIDDYNGLKDLKEGNIRILHSLSFIEDPTRIFRAVRFANRFGYRIDSNTKRFAKAAVEPLKTLSQNRLMQELSLIRKETTSIAPFKMLDDLLIWKNLMGITVTDEEYAHARSILNEMDANVFYILTSLCYHKDNWNELLQPYILTAKSRLFVQDLAEVRQELELDIPSMDQLHEKLYTISDEVLVFLSLDRCLKQHKIIDAYYKQRSLLTPLLTGDDLIEAGMKPSPEFRKILFAAEKKQMNQTLTTKEEALSWLKSIQNEKEANQF
ncbi:CBS domain-containing protein [Bacillus sp. FJAT-45037]|uniref:CBS domain-containing protein n=1 Tax=Bacillus sp. FJAT-45037 TaxID=2011007 RepID=UPI000C23CC1B|nr:CBS domain-containing protein [Bacillus sp. FJAT-45037]